MWTPEFESFVAPARRKPELWRLIVGVVLILIVYAIGVIALFVGVTIPSLLETEPLAAVPREVWLQDFLQGRNPTGVVALLLSFGGMIAGAWLAVLSLHARGFASLWGAPLCRFFWPAAGITLAVGLAAAGLSLMLGLADEVELVRNTPTAIFLTFLPAALIALAVQTGAEEVVFRGYLQTQLAARFRSPLVWMLVPSLLFGALHADPMTLIETGTLAPNDGYILAATTLVGLLTADLTRVTGNLGAAWGLHFANNVQALLLVSFDDMLSGLSLWKTPFGPEDLETLPLLLVQDMVLLMIIWALIRLWIARRARA